MVLRTTVLSGALVLHHATLITGVPCSPAGTLISLTAPYSMLLSPQPILQCHPYRPCSPSPGKDLYLPPFPTPSSIVLSTPLLSLFCPVSHCPGPHSSAYIKGSSHYRQDTAAPAPGWVGGDGRGSCGFQSPDRAGFLNQWHMSSRWGLGRGGETRSAAVGLPVSLLHGLIGEPPSSLIDQWD